MPQKTKGMTKPRRASTARGRIFIPDTNFGMLPKIVKRLQRDGIDFCMEEVIDPREWGVKFCGCPENRRCTCSYPRPLLGKSTGTLITYPSGLEEEKGDKT